MELYQRIAEETRNKIRLEKTLEKEQSKLDKEVKKMKKPTQTTSKKDEEKESQRRLDTEVLHQTEEAERRALGRAMMSDAANNKRSFNNSCLKLLNNYQGMIFNLDVFMIFSACF